MERQDARGAWTCSKSRTWRSAIPTKCRSGEARRILIARALVHDPQALVLDEPTTSLDLRATWELREILRKLAGNGISILMVTHHLPDIIPEMRRVVLIREGRVVLDGPKEQVLEAGALSGAVRRAGGSAGARRILPRAVGAFVPVSLLKSLPHHEHQQERPLRHR